MRLFDDLMAHATREGRIERAEILRQGALAISSGVAPSEIDILFRDRTLACQAIVVGVRRPGPDGGQVLDRSLIAWTGTPVSGALQVSTVADTAAFDAPWSVEARPPARGAWQDLAADEFWVTPVGSVEIRLAATDEGTPLPVPGGGRYLPARYDLRIHGMLARRGGPGPAFPIHAEAKAVQGVVVSRLTPTGRLPSIRP
jgi:hypothetical protein